MRKLNSKLKELVNLSSLCIIQLFANNDKKVAATENCQKRW